MELKMADYYWFCEAEIPKHLHKNQDQQKSISINDNCYLENMIYTKLNIHLYPEFAEEIYWRQETLRDE